MTTTIQHSHTSPKSPSGSAASNVSTPNKTSTPNKKAVRDVAEKLIDHLETEVNDSSVVAQEKQKDKFMGALLQRSVDMKSFSLVEKWIYVKILGLADCSLKELLEVYPDQSVFDVESLVEDLQFENTFLLLCTGYKLAHARTIPEEANQGVIDMQNKAKAVFDDSLHALETLNPKKFKAAYADLSSIESKGFDKTQLNAQFLANLEQEKDVLQKHLDESKPSSLRKVYMGGATIVTGALSLLAYCTDNIPSVGTSFISSLWTKINSTLLPNAGTLDVPQQLVPPTQITPENVSPLPLTSFRELAALHSRNNQPFSPLTSQPQTNPEPSLPTQTTLPVSETPQLEDANTSPDDRNMPITSSVADLIPSTIAMGPHIALPYLETHANISNQNNAGAATDQICLANHLPASASIDLETQFPLSLATSSTELLSPSSSTLAAGLLPIAAQTVLPAAQASVGYSAIIHPMMLQTPATFVAEVVTAPDYMETIASVASVALPVIGFAAGLYGGYRFISWTRTTLLSKSDHSDSAPSSPVRVSHSTSTPKGSSSHPRSILKQRQSSAAKSSVASASSPPAAPSSGTRQRAESGVSPINPVRAIKFGSETVDAQPEADATSDLPTLEDELNNPQLRPTDSQDEIFILAPDSLLGSPTDKVKIVELEEDELDPLVLTAKGEATLLEQCDKFRKIINSVKNVDELPQGFKKDIVTLLADMSARLSEPTHSQSDPIVDSADVATPSASSSQQSMVPSTSRKSHTKRRLSLHASAAKPAAAESVMFTPHRQRTASTQGLISPASLELLGRAAEANTQDFSQFWNPDQGMQTLKTLRIFAAELNKEVATEALETSRDVLTLICEQMADYHKAALEVVENIADHKENILPLMAEIHRKQKQQAYVENLMHNMAWYLNRPSLLAVESDSQDAIDLPVDPSLTLVDQLQTINQFDPKRKIKQNLVVLKGDVERFLKQIQSSQEEITARTPKTLRTLNQKATEINQSSSALRPDAKPDEKAYLEAVQKVAQANQEYFQTLLKMGLPQPSAASASAAAFVSVAPLAAASASNGSAAASVQADGSNAAVNPPPIAPPFNAPDAPPQAPTFNAPDAPPVAPPFGIGAPTSQAAKKEPVKIVPYSVESFAKHFPFPKKELGLAYKSSMLENEQLSNEFKSEQISAKKHWEAQSKKLFANILAHSNPASEIFYFPKRDEQKEPVAKLKEKKESDQTLLQQLKSELATAKSKAAELEEAQPEEESEEATLLTYFKNQIETSAVKIEKAELRIAVLDAKISGQVKAKPLQYIQAELDLKFADEELLFVLAQYSAHFAAHGDKPLVFSQDEYKATFDVAEALTAQIVADEQALATKNGSLENEKDKYRNTLLLFIKHSYEPHSAAWINYLTDNEETVIQMLDILKSREKNSSKLATLTPYDPALKPALKDGSATTTTLVEALKARAANQTPLKAVQRTPAFAPSTPLDAVKERMAQMQTSMAGNPLVTPRAPRRPGPSTPQTPAVGSSMKPSTFAATFPVILQEHANQMKAELELLLAKAADTFDEMDVSKYGEVLAEISASSSAEKKLQHKELVHLHTNYERLKAFNAAGDFASKWMPVYKPFATELSRLKPSNNGSEAVNKTVGARIAFFQHLPFVFTQLIEELTPSSASSARSPQQLKQKQANQAKSALLQTDKDLLETWFTGNNSDISASGPIGKLVVKLTPVFEEFAKNLEAKKAASNQVLSLEVLEELSGKIKAVYAS